MAFDIDIKRLWAGDTSPEVAEVAAKGRRLATDPAVRKIVDGKDRHDQQAQER